MPPTYYRGCWHVVSRGFFCRYSLVSSLLKAVYDPKASVPHAASLRQGCPHCARFPTAASRRSLGRVSVPIWPVGLSTRLPVVGTVGRHPAVYLMGRGAIPSRRGFSPGAMRHPGVSGITRPFGRLSRGRGQVLHVLLSRSPLASTRRWVPFDLHVLGAPPAFILSQDRTLRPKYVWASSPSGPLSHSLIGSVRFIWFCLIGKGISRGRLSAALRKTNPSQTISNGSMSARMRHIWCVHPRSIRFSRCTPSRLIRSDRAARQGDILPDRRGPRGGNHALHILFTNKLILQLFH